MPRRCDNVQKPFIVKTEARAVRCATQTCNSLSPQCSTEKASDADAPSKSMASGDLAITLWDDCLQSGSRQRHFLAQIREVERPVFKETGFD
jgi:hypothetical protein